jgi:hypothetical protein
MCVCVGLRMCRQLNDIWQAPTWSSLEYGGRWKLLHHAARHFFAPLLVSSFRATPTSDPYAVHMVSDVPEALEGTMQLQVWAWAGGALIEAVSVPYALAPLEARAVYTSTISSLTRGNPTGYFFVLRANATAVRGEPSRTVHLCACMCALPLRGCMRSSSLLAFSSLCVAVAPCASLSAPV